MPKIAPEIPEKIRPYNFHGVSLNWQNPQPGGKGKLYSMGDCPFCSKDDKFHVDQEGLYGCFKCNAKGNVYNFLRWLYQESVERTRDYHALSTGRGLLDGAALVQWGVCKSILTNDWLIPGWGVDGSLNNLYRYMHSVKEGRMVTTPTPGVGHQLHGVNLYKSENPLVFLCEGWSDGVALWEILSRTKQIDGEYLPTGNIEKSLLADCSVLAAPTASVFFPSWAPLFAGKTVTLLYDNDHRREHPQTGKPIDGAGLLHTKRVAGILSNSDNPPEQINYLSWGELGFDPELPSGFDVRDQLVKVAE